VAPTPAPSPPDVIRSRLVAHHQLAAEMTTLDDAVWESEHTDATTLELCRLRMATLLNSRAELAYRTPSALAAGMDEDVVAELANWPSSPRFDDAARACLAFCEQFVIDVASLDDATATAVRSSLGDSAFVTFVHALKVLEQRIRLTLAWDRLFGPLEVLT
jgi:alkylhydroperoxidase family enzyme